MLQGVLFLEGYYEVFWGHEPVGKVQLMQKGLYCRVLCRCRLPEDQVLRLYAVQNGKQENLGVLVPEGEGFFLDKMIPAKRLGSGDTKFIVSSGMHSANAGRFVPISPEEPFLYIDRLKTAFLESEHGKIGIRIQQNPEAV